MPIGQPVVKDIAGTMSNLVSESKEEQPLEPLEVSQHVKMTDKNGVTYEGDFILRIPTVGDMRKIEVTKSMLADGVPVSSLDPSAVSFLHALATCYVMFAAKGKDSGEMDAAPAWWHTMSMDDVPPQLIWALHDAVRDHENRYFRPDAATGRSTTGRCVVELTKRSGDDKGDES